MNFVTVKLWFNTRQVARIVAAYTGESLVKLFHRLILEEAKRKNINITP